MATSSDAKGFKQDMVVSIRYRNDLPPPPMPPKFLDIDTGGLAQYLTTSYASSLVKREDPNIEVDAEGGMPIDMIGVPGYFLGDESAIMAPEIQPVLDPADQALMLTVDQLRNQGTKNNVSFLRKTEYIASGAGAGSRAAANPFMRSQQRPRKPLEEGANQPRVSREDPSNIKKHIQKGFDTAYPESASSACPSNPPTIAERDAWTKPVHPTNPRLKPVATYPILPDVEAITTLGDSWYAVRFDKPPLAPRQSRRDDRLDVGLLSTAMGNPQLAAWQARKDAYDRDPERYEDPGEQPYSWGLSIPKNPDATARVRKMFDDGNPDKDDPSLRDGLLEESTDGQMRIPFERARLYHSVTETAVDPRRIMAVSLVDTDKLPAHSRFQAQGNAAYYYPIMSRLRLKADRGNLGKRAQDPQDADEDSVSYPDQTMVLFKEPDALELETRYSSRGKWDSAFQHEWEKIQAAAKTMREEMEEEEAERQQAANDVDMREGGAGADDDEDQDHAGANGVTNGDRGGSSPRRNGRAEESDEDMGDY